ncbi:uncharacterized protein TM35_000142800 [Trypanosoma theileri]|uniref:Uncharacterized protein n=1 Tax=Trypanosoma theileri TaxID=67003 RepID=A0A1X0NXX2_9TRYP|nr:uncharacterized protein TM35_000142800 [Trypanosoma theileri]ORC89069.1 hypothetical protein TM35_000142800 [Trypanosoma theileri]
MRKEVPPHLWTAVEVFLSSGHAEAGVLLRDELRRAALTSNITSQEIPPRMFSEALFRYYEGTISVSSLLLISILNRMFCLLYIPEALARPINDRRPSDDFSELLRFYLQCLRTPHLPGTVLTQLYFCIASLLLLQPNGNVIEGLLSVFGGTVPTEITDIRVFMRLFSTLMSVLSDRRVLMGPIRRSTQRLCVQNSMHLILTSMPIEDLTAQATMISQGVSFLTECTVNDAQDMAPLFWSQLPSSLFWKYAVHQLQNGTASEAILESITTILRSLTMLDTTAVTLIQSVLTAIHSDGTRAPLSHICSVITSILESSVEAVVVQFGPEHTLYQALALSAQMLRSVLTDPASVEGMMNTISSQSLETLLVVCEGLSVLAQVLTPVSIPVMDETDDPEDYAMVVDDIHKTNTCKLEALRQLREFMESCQIALLTWLGRLSASDTADIAMYLSANDGDEFAVRHDELPIALFTTYERLCRLLLPARHSRVEAIAAEGYIIAAVWDADLSYQAIVAQQTLLHCKEEKEQQQEEVLRRLVQNAPLFPLVSRRYKDHWSTEQISNIVFSLIELLREAVMSLNNILVAADISKALRQLGIPPLQNVMESLWNGVLLSCGEDKTPRWELASHLSFLMQESHMELTCGCFDVEGLDDHTRVELNSCIVRSLQDVWGVMQVLQGVESDAVQSHRAAERIAAWVQTSMNINTPEWKIYEQMVREWSGMNPLHFRVVWRLVRPLDLLVASEILATALEAFVTQIEKNGDFEWKSEKDCFSHYVLNTLAQSPNASRLQRVLISLLRSFTCAEEKSRGFRLSAVVRAGLALLQGRCCCPSLILEVFCEAVKEYASLHQTVSSLTLGNERENKDDNKEEGEEEEGEGKPMWLLLLSELAMLGEVARMVVELPQEAPPWLYAVRNAVDEFEVQRILKEV